MATLNPTITVRGGGFGGDGSPDYAGRLRRARLGMAVALTPIAMLFVAFTSAYIVRQGLPTLDDRTGTYVRDWLTVNLPLSLLAVNTAVLIASSITLELARRQAARHTALSPVRAIGGVFVGRERSGWLTLTIMLGAAFLTGQWLAWRELAARGIYVATSPSSSFVYLLTAAHAVHLAGGMLALLAAAVIAWLRGAPERRYIVIDAAAWYWHFMALLWVYIFALLYFAR